MSFEQKDTKSRQNTDYDPNTSEVNQLRKLQLQGAIKATGGIPQLIKPRPDLAMPGSGELDILRRLEGLSRAPLVSPYEERGFGALEEINKMPFEDIISRGVNTMMAGTAPTVTNNLTAAGLGRSGAVGEALAGAGADMTLPLLQQAMNARLGSAQGMAQMGTALGQNLASREANRLLTGLDAAGFGRQARYNEEVTRPSGLLMSLITGMPTFNAPLSTRGATHQTGWGIDIGQIIGAVGGMAAMCWVAEALYGKHAVETMLARYWITIGWQGRGSRIGRFLYRKIGKPIAWLTRRSKLVRRLLKPLFDRAVRAGARDLEIEVMV